MGLFIAQNEKRSELQSKIIADLQEKVHATSEIEGATKEPEPKFLEDQHQTRGAGMFIGLLLVVLAVVIIFIVARS